MPQTAIQWVSLAIVDTNVIEVPGDHTFLSVGLDDGAQPAIWFIVDPESPPCKIEIIMVGDDEVVPHVHEFLGTIRVRRRTWHVFTSPRSFGANKRENLAAVTGGR